MTGALRGRALLGATVGALAVAAGAGSADAAATTTTITTSQAWRVPAYVTSVSIEAVGGKGASSTRSGGFGADAVAANVPVAAGDMLQIHIGANGARQASTGGGNGGGAGTYGGGGATDVRSDADTLASRIVVAGGGGGAGDSAAGGDAGAAGGDDNLFTCTGGQPGTSTAGGSAGLDQYGTAVATPGDVGVGGNGETPGGGGGGGGLWGGGGGGSGGATYGCGGGGGSSGSATGAAVTATPDTTGVPSVTLTYTPSPPATERSYASTKTFATMGCAVWTVPAGVTSLHVQATGAGGGAGAAGSSEEAPGGAGDRVSATLSSVAPGGPLDVCVDAGGGPGGPPLGTQFGSGGGGGGGASGVAVGSDFASPALVAAGGGGGGGDAATGALVAGLGARAQTTGGMTSEGECGKDNTWSYNISVNCCSGNTQFSGAVYDAGSEGRGATALLAGTGGVGDGRNPGGGPGGAGADPSASGPGAGGSGGSAWGGVDGGGIGSGGGGGGAGYRGGGGGAGGAERNKACSGYTAAGGGGGSDYCASDVTDSSCSIVAAAGTGTTAGTGAGDSNVVLAYTAAPLPTATTGASSAVTTSSAGVSGSISNPSQLSGYTYLFRYGTTTSYGWSTASTTIGTAGGTASGALSGLAPETTYHYQLVVTGPAGDTEEGGDQTFMTTSDRETTTEPQTSSTTSVATAGSATGSRPASTAPPGVPSLTSPPTAAHLAPDTTITQRRQRRRTATFAFQATIPGATFQCRFDRKLFRPCRSPVRLAKLGRGRHTFRVRAVAAGVPDPTPASSRFTVR